MANQRNNEGLRWYLYQNYEFDRTLATGKKKKEKQGFEGVRKGQRERDRTKKMHLWPRNFSYLELSTSYLESITHKPFEICKFT